MARQGYHAVMRRRTGPALLALAATLALAACQRAPRVIATGPFPPPAGARRLPLPPPIGARPLPLPPLHIEPPAQQQDAAWSFTVAGNACEARVAGPDVWLAMRATADRTLQFTLSTSARAPLPGQAGAVGQVAFAGGGGAWSLPVVRGAGRSTTASLPLNEASVDQARNVLGGGTVRLAGREAPPPLLIPDAGIAGRDWLGCVLSKLAG